MSDRVKNTYLDFFKGLACFGVVFSHVKWPNYYLDGVVQAVFRFVIPLFFMVSGYFCFAENRENLQKKMPAKIRHIFMINLIGCGYYFVYQMLVGMFGRSHGSLQDVIARFSILFNKKTMTEWIVFNQDPFVNIMWFTSALLYCYLLMCIVNKFNLYRICYLLIPVLLTIHLVLGNVLSVCGIDVSLLYYRNFLLFGFPFFMFGHFIHTNKERLREKFLEGHCKCMMGIGAVLSIVEWFFFGRQEMFVGSILFVFGAFLLSLHQPQKKQNSFWTTIGAKYSLFIYIVHVSVNLVLEIVEGKLFANEGTGYLLYAYTKPFLVFLISFFAGIVFYKVIDQMKRIRSVS